MGASSRWLIAVAVAVGGLIGCLQADQVVCDDGTLCPRGTACSDGERRCVVPEQRSSCNNKADGQACDYPGVPDGACDRGLCVPAGCGNGVQEMGEVCDDGNRAPQDGCSADCTSEEVCGNGLIDGLVGEACDDGTHCTDGTECSETSDCVGVGDERCVPRSGDGCQANCAAATCGDGVTDTQFNERCDCGTDPDALPNGCTAVNGDVPDAECRRNCLPRKCGDGIVDVAAGEQCDEGDNLPGDGCSGSCQDEICGNGTLDLKLQAGELVPAEACDDGANNLSHDGCTNTCSVEPARWQERVVPLAQPQPYSAVVYDIARGALVAVGSASSAFGQAETWEWDGAAWTRKISAVEPVARDFHALSYDLRRRRVVLFGGVGATGGRDDTWEWDGSEWVELAPTVAPPARRFHVMAYDAARGVVVLFGGETYRGLFPGTPLGDTWEWDGTRWTELTPPNSPSPRGRHAMVYDPRRGVVVLHGGDGGVRTDDTWEWDGTRWTERTPASRPSARSGHSLAYDASRGVVTLFSGYDGTSLLSDMWLWDGVGWTEQTAIGTGPAAGQLISDFARQESVLFGGASGTEMWRLVGDAWAQIPSAISPARLIGHALAYDARRGITVLFGGFDDPSNTNDDTWEWNGSSWTQARPASAFAPAPQSVHAMAYDAAREVVVLFGGETWTWDGTTWLQKVPVVEPPARSGHAMAYDAARRVVVLFGGGQLGDTWEWDGTNWTERVGTGGPVPRMDHAMVYDAARRVTVMFGGYDGSKRLGDTWEWDGVVWTERSYTAGPSARTNAALAYDPARGATVLFGGWDVDGREMADTWEWDGQNWYQTDVRVAPSARSGARAVYDAARGSVVLFGGWDDLGLSGTWLYQHSAGVSENCLTGFDADGDGLVGCADPDCWGYCTPNCPPGTTASWPADCSTSEPHCGDAVCNANLESCRLCPSDCGQCTAVCGDFLCDAGETSATCPGDCS